MDNINASGAAIKANALATYLFTEIVKDLGLPKEVLVERRELAIDRANLFLDVYENGDTEDIAALCYLVLARNGYEAGDMLRQPEETLAIRKLRRQIEAEAEQTRTAIASAAITEINNVLKLVDCKLTVDDKDGGYVFLTMQGSEVLYTEVVPDMECFVWRLGNAIYEKTANQLFDDVVKSGLDKHCFGEVVCDAMEYNDEPEDFCIAVAHIGRIAAEHDAVLWEKYAIYFNVCDILTDDSVIGLLSLEEIRQGMPLTET